MYNSGVGSKPNDPFHAPHLTQDAYETRLSGIGPWNAYSAPFWQSPRPLCILVLVPFQEYCRRVRSYHARRIAHFAVNGWNGDPITLKADGSMCDGLHRWRAAKHLGMEEVEVIIAGEV